MKTAEVDVGKVTVQIEIFKHSKVIEIAQDLMKYAEGLYDVDFIRCMLKDSKYLVDSFNWENQTVANPTIKELNIIRRSMLRRVIDNHCKHDSGYIKYGASYDLFRDAVLNVKIPDHLISSKILLKRRVGKIQNCNHIEQELNEMLLNELYNCFVEQNKELIQKHTVK